MKENYIYPETITENFDIANFHIKYCLGFIKKYLKGDVLEVGAGCGSFTRNYFSKKISSLTLTEIRIIIGIKTKIIYLLTNMGLKI